MGAETAKCLECTTGVMAGPIPGTLANGKRCDICEVYASDREAALAITTAELLNACKHALKACIDYERVIQGLLKPPRGQRQMLAMQIEVSATLAIIKAAIAKAEKETS